MNMFHITGQVHKLLGALNLINDAGILTDLYDLCESSLASNPASWTLLEIIVPICRPLAVVTEYKKFEKEHIIMRKIKEIL